MIDPTRLLQFKQAYRDGAPFRHVVLDDFLPAATARKVCEEFPGVEDTRWYRYRNPLEDKYALCDWNAFPRHTYSVFRWLVSPEFVAALSELVEAKLYADPGLHGGGWHMHALGGKLNPHLDYSIHPKTGLQRKLNLIIYLPEEWSPGWGGHLGLWQHDPVTNRPGRLVKEVEVAFNRAILFDTTQNSWHGLSRPVTTPTRFRKSLAVYYLCDAPASVDTRGKALFAPTEDQVGDERIEELVRQRADMEKFEGVYRTK